MEQVKMADRGHQKACVRRNPSAHSNAIFNPRKGMAQDKDHAVLLPEETLQTLQVFKLRRTGRSPSGEDGETLVFIARSELCSHSKDL